MKILKLSIALLGLFTTATCSQNEHARLREDFTTDWRFTNNDDSLASNIEYDDSKWRQLNLPHDWSIEFDFAENVPATALGGALPGGIGWYRKSFIVPKENENKDIYIDFDGVYRNSEVWINGQYIGKRPYGYSSFRYDLTPYLKFGEINTIAVRVDNSKQPNSRWYSGSGIYRNVWLVTLNKVHVAHWGTYITTSDITEKSAMVLVETKVENKTSAPIQIQLVSKIIDATGKEQASTKGMLSIEADKVSEIKQNIQLSDPILWSVDNPYLYKVLTEVKSNGKTIDSYETPLGVRFFEFNSEKGFFLNGKHLKIRGVCLHHDLGCLGSAINTRAIERQLQILKDMGCNGIRTAHNPPAPELLDLCDKMGFIVQDEAFDMWRKRKTDYDYSWDFSEWHETDLRDMILRDRNHPSIFMWSIGNEVLEQWTDINTDTLSAKDANIMFNFASTLHRDKAKTDNLHCNSLLTIRLVDIIKSLDTTRLVTAGSNEIKNNNHLIRSGALDILGFNYSHSSWAKLPEMYPGKRIIITESTSSIMSRGFYEMPSDSMFIRPVTSYNTSKDGLNQCSAYDNSFVPWGSSHETSLVLSEKLDHISGIYVWTGFDYFGEPTPYWWPTRSAYFGIVDMAGFPKDAYYLYQSMWTDKPVLHLFPHWNWTEGEIVDVWAYYNNADEVELILNNKSLGVKSKQGDQQHVFWQIRFEKGTLRAILRRNGQEVLSQQIQTAGKPASIRMTADRNIITADRKDLSFITVEVLDAEGNPVPIANNLIKFEIEGEGIIAGTDNGDATNHVSLKKPERNLFNGKALVVVQSTNKKGVILLKAKSESLREAQLEIKTK